MTPEQRRVPEILLQEHGALGACNSFGRLPAEGPGWLPPVACRAPDFVVTHGFAHHIERLNAFVPCAHPGTGHAPAFLIYRICDTVA